MLRGVNPHPPDGVRPAQQNVLIALQNAQLNLNSALSLAIQLWQSPHFLSGIKEL